MTTDIIWNQYANQMRTFIRSQIHDEQTTDDILQNVFVKIHSDVTQIDKIGNMKAWLYRMVKNMMVDYFRSLKHTSEIDDSISEETISEPIIENVASSIRFFINQLDEPLRKLMILSELKGYSQIEISKELNIPYSTIKSRIQKGRHLVKEMLLDCCHYEFDRRGTVIDYECKKC